jgi:hypothetical protein
LWHSHSWLCVFFRYRQPQRHRALAREESHWRLWTDAIIHAIHNRVFLHVKNLAEADARRIPN